MKFRNVFLLMLVSAQLLAQSNPNPWFTTKKLNNNVWRISDGDIDNIKGVVSLKDLYVSDDLTLFKDLLLPALFVPTSHIFPSSI